MNVLPHGGDYRITIDRPSKKRYVLRVTLMDPHDPRLDPGIQTDRVSIAPEFLHWGKPLSLKPYEPGSFCQIDENWPAHLGMEDYGFGVEIMRVEGLKKAWWEDPEQLKALGRLELALNRQTAPANPPLDTDKDAGFLHWGKPELIEGKSLRALRWVVELTNGRGPLQNPLEYMVQAETNDGRYFLQIRMEVEYLNPPAGLTKPSDADLLDRAFDAFQRKVNGALAAASPDSFKPSLKKLDTAVRALELR